MTYFPNGESGMMFMEHFCSRCKNMRDKNDGRGEGCPIIDLHILWNYDAIGVDADKVKHEALEHFIPTAEEYGAYDECKMFLPIEGYEHMGAAQRNLDAKKLKEWEAAYGKPK